MFNAISLWRMARPLWSLSFILGLLTLISGIALLAYSGWFISAAAMAGVAGSQAGSFNYLRPGAMIRLLAITRTAGRYAERLQSHYTILQVLKQLRLNCFSLLSKSYNPFQTFRSGRFNTLQQLIADIDVLDQYPLKLLLPYAWAFSITTLASGLLIWLQPSLIIPVTTTWFFLLVALPATQVYVFSKLALSDALHQSARREDMLEQMSALTTLTMLGQSAPFLSQFADAEMTSAVNRRVLQRITSVFSCIQQLSLVTVAALILQITNYNSAALIVGCCLGVLALSEVLAPLNHAHTILGNFKAARSRLEKLAVQPDLSIQNHDYLVSQTAALRINNLVWQHSQVRPLNLSATAGNIVLISGASGCGKSSLFATIASELRLCSGEIVVQGQNAEISWLDQHPYIFGLTIAANLRIAAPSATDQQLLDVLALVELSDWLQQQKDGIKACFDQQQLGLSGGELRRFGLARCLLKSAPILLLDEPFAGLSAEQALRILRRIERHAEQQVCVIISHQLHEQSIFDQIIQLN